MYDTIRIVYELVPSTDTPLLLPECSTKVCTDSRPFYDVGVVVGLVYCAERRRITYTMAHIHTHTNTGTYNSQAGRYRWMDLFNTKSQQRKVVKMNTTYNSV